jgi:hypothetical protein
MHWNNNIIEREKVQFPPPISHSMKAFFPAKLYQTVLIEEGVENGRELGKKKGLHNVNRRMIGISLDHLLKTPVTDNTWDDA